MTPETAARTRLPGAAFLSFAAFGAFWGAWGASVPRVQDQTGVGDGGLGVALLFIGAGALPAMLLTGRALDRFGLRVSSWLIGALGASGALLALVAVDLLTLCAALALVGATSGAADVAMNSVAGRAEAEAGRPVITRAHGVFSAAVVVGTLLTGTAAGAGLGVALPFLVVAGLSVVAGALLAVTLPGPLPTEADEGPPVADAASRRTVLVPLLLVGVLGALAFAAENAHQSWSAVYAHDELGTSTALASVAPAAFALTVSITRLAAGGLSTAHARSVLVVGATAAATGTLVLALAPGLPVAVAGLVVAAAGTAVIFPTLVGVVSRDVAESYRGRATSVLTTVAYLGFLVGPVYVGLWADRAGLRGAMVAVAALGAALVVLGPVLLRLSGFGRPPRAAAVSRTPTRARSAPPSAG
jgi:MFS family permease